MIFGVGRSFCEFLKLKNSKERVQKCLENAQHHQKMLERVHNIMAPFGLIFVQSGSHRLWEASGMPPGL